MHVAIISHELISRFNTSMEFADRLALAGHRVTYITHADVGVMVRAHGHGFRQLSSTPARPTWLRRPSLRGLVPWVQRARDLRNITAADDEIERTVAAIDPDLLLIDIEMHYAVIAATELPVPAMLYMNWFCIYRMPDVPPMNSAIVPTGTKEDSRRIQRAWRRARVDTWMRRVRRKLGPATIGDLLRPVSYATYHYADVKAVARARRVNLKARSNRREWLEPLMFMDLPVLSFTAREMDFPYDTHPNMRYVGPMIADARPVSNADQASHDAWIDYLSARDPSVDHGPVVYCSMGSYLTDVGFLRTVIEVFRRRPEWSLVLGLGRQVTREALGDTPANVFVLDWAPQLEVLALADAAIIHGGSSSVHECIVNDVPVVVYPPGRGDLDQAGNAARVEYHGLGLVGKWGSDGPAEIEAHLDRLISEPSFVANIAAMREVFNTYRTDDTAIAALERQLSAAGGDAPGTISA